MVKSGHQLVRLIAALALVGAVGLAMLPLRNAEDAIAIGLLLAVPLAAAAAIGGPVVGALTALGTLFFYDLVFVPPYGSLTFAHAKDAIPLIVYGAAAVSVASLATWRRGALAEERRRAAESRHLVEAMGVMAGNQPLSDLLQSLVASVRETFGLDAAELLVPEDEGYVVVASAGTSIAEEERRLVAPVGGAPQSLGGVLVGSRRIVGVPLASAGEAVGLLVCSGPDVADERLGALRVYADQVAFALERFRLRERALETELLRRVDAWRAALLGAVSHDLRTPLATVKAAVSDLRNEVVGLSESDRAELLELVEAQADRLDRLVANLLDMTRIEFGELELRKETTTIDKLLTESVAAFGAAKWTDRVVASIPSDIPPVFVDHVLICQVFANLLENAERHAPEGTPIEVRARSDGDLVEVAVEDRGPGVPNAERERVFKMFNRISGGGRAGLGLAIVDAFVAAHGQTVRVEERAGGGARFLFTLPAATA